MIELPPGHDFSPLVASDIDELVIDLPPGVPAYTRRLIGQADAVLVPCRPSPDDLSAAAGRGGDPGARPLVVRPNSNPAEIAADRWGVAAARRLAAWRRQASACGRITRLPRSRGGPPLNSLGQRAPMRLSSCVAT
jgi:hypothetical protein